MPIEVALAVATCCLPRPLRVWPLSTVWFSMSLTLSGEKVVPQCLEVPAARPVVGGGGSVLLACAGDAVWGVVCCFARMRHAWVLRTCGPGAVVVDDPGAARESRCAGAWSA